MVQIRPTKLPFLETYDLAGAVAFVSNAIAYEPPENSLHPPEHLLSPQSVLSFQAGDSFDMASLLVRIWQTSCTLTLLSVQDNHHMYPAN